MFSSPQSALAPLSTRRAAMFLAATVLATMTLLAHQGSLARAQSQCYNSRGGSSCTNYSSDGKVSSTYTCTDDANGDTVCVTAAPNSPDTYSVCTDGACSGSAGTPASSIKESVVEAAMQVPSVSWTPCNIAGKGMVWVPSQSFTGVPVKC